MLKIKNIAELAKLIQLIAFRDSNISDDAGINMAKTSVYARASSADENVLTNDFLVLVDATAAPVTETLPPAFPRGQILAFKKTDSSANSVIIAANTGDTIEGGSTFDLTDEGETILLVSDMVSNWVILSRNNSGFVVGPSSSVDNHIAIYDGATGKLIKDAVNAFLSDDGTTVAFVTNSNLALHLRGDNEATLESEHENVRLTVDDSTKKIASEVGGVEKVNVSDNGLNVGQPRTVTAEENIEPTEFDKVGLTIRAHTTPGGAVTPATGGIITHTGGFYYHEFNSGGNIVWPGSGGPSVMDYMMVAGGGGGGFNAGGGGGGGGFIEKFSQSVPGGTQAIVIGAKGQGGHNSNAGVATNGGDTTFNGDTAVGGGYGANNSNLNGNSGGSGGGGSGTGAAGTGGAGTGGQGNAGGNNPATAPDYGSGGGGGAAAGGANGSGSGGGNGGNGALSTIATALNGSNTYFGGGGGGSTYNGLGSGGTGGLGGGANGAAVGDATAATANTGGGGGGNDYFGGTGSTAGDGATGKVIIRYPDTIGDQAQTADLEENLDDSGAVMSGIDCGGNYFMPTATGLTAAGSAQGDALEIGYGLNELTTVATSTGVRFLAGKKGIPVIVVNRGAHTVNVYPATGGQIDALGTNNPDTIASNSIKRYAAISATQWYSI